MPDRTSSRVPPSPPPSLPARLPWELDDPDELGPEHAPATPTAPDTPTSAGATVPGGADLDLDPDVDFDGATSHPAAAPPERSSRLRVGLGAAVVLVIVALVCAVLVSMFSGRGRVEVVAPGAAGGGGPATTSAGSTSAAPGAQGTSDASASSPGSSAAGSTSTSSTTPPGPGSPTAAPLPGALILLHVLGAVARPGLYQLHAGDRVIDAVSAAGGFTPNADQTQQNLARTVTDGEQLVIPEQGAAPPLGSAAAGTTGLVPGGAPGGGAAGSPGTGSAGAAGQTALINLNTADQTLLETLPQVGPALAQRIIAWRTTNGRFTQLEDLKNVAGIGDKTFAALQPLVTL